MGKVKKRDNDSLISGNNYRFYLINNLIVILSLGMLFYLGILYYLEHFFGMGNQVSFLFGKLDVFMDFFNVNYFVNDLNPYGKDVSYPPFATFIAYPFTIGLDYMTWGPLAIRGSISGMISYAIFVLIFYPIFIYQIYRSIKGQGLLKDIYTVLIITASFPVLFLFDRGNYLIVTAICIYFFFYYYQKEKHIAVVYLSIAIALKVYPIVLLVLLLLDKKYKDILRVVFITGFLSSFPLLFYKGSFLWNVENFIRNILVFSKGYSSDIVANAYSISLISLIKLPLMLINNGKMPYDVLGIYSVIAIIMTVMTLLILNKEKEFWKKVLYLMILMNLFQKNSPDYNLVYFIIPMLFFFNKTSAEKFDKWYICFYGLLLIPKSLIPLYTLPPSYIVSISSILHPLIQIFALSVYILYNYKLINESLKDIQLVIRKVMFKSRHSKYTDNSKAVFHD
jgi:hypothetical protein